MRHPAPVTLQPQTPWVYCGISVLIAIILIALYAGYMPAGSGFSSKSRAWWMLAIGLTATVALWALVGSWRKPLGRLVFVRGLWHWQRGDQEVMGTLSLHLDLQNYLLVRFIPSQPARSIFHTTSPWFHLQARHFKPASSSALVHAWSDVRRAVYFSQAVSQAVDAREKPAL